MSLSVNYSFVGAGDWSLDAISGSATDGGLVQAVVPEGATVEAAFLYATGYFSASSAGDVDFAGTTLNSGQFVSLGAAGTQTAFRADVTGLVSAIVGDGAATPFDFEIANVMGSNINGYALAVVYSDPDLPQRSIAFADGASQTQGDGFTINFDQPVDTTLEGFSALLSLGIGHGAQGSSQFSEVDVSGRRLTSFAGGSDDGASTNGGLITIGGLGDDPTNPDDPNARGFESSFDDELYDLAQGSADDPTPYLENGATSLSFAAENPSNDDIIFLVAINVLGEALVDSVGNDRPTAVNDAFSVSSIDDATTFTVTDNDLDPDGDALSVVALDTSSTLGRVVDLGDGRISYDPLGQFDGLAYGDQATDTFSYTVSDGKGGTDTATVTVTVNGPPLDARLSLPDQLEVGATGQAVLTIDNPVPSLVAISAERGLLADPLSGALSETVFVLSDGSGDEAELFVDVRGTAGPRSRIDAEARVALPNAETDLAARYVAFQPDFLEDAVVSRIEANVASIFGDTMASLTSALTPYASQLGSFGLDATSATAALAFGFEAAGDFGSLEARGTAGSLGLGWSTLADLGLSIDGTTVRLNGLTEIGALSALTTGSSALYTLSNSVGRSVSLSGDVLALTQPARPYFEQLADRSFVNAGNFDGTLRETDEGYALTTSDGDRLIFDGDGLFLRFETADGLTTIATYDAAGQMTGLVGPEGAELSFSRDSDGRITSIEDADGETMAFTYTPGGLLTEAASDAGVAQFAYNASGDLTTATAPGDITSAFTYDALGRLVRARYGDSAQIETVSYDADGGLTITDGAGTETQIDLLPNSVVGRITDGLGGASEIFYDDNGDLAGIRAADGTETLLDFDDQGRLTRITDANGAELSFGYDGTSENPTSFTDAGGNTRSFAYDEGGRITSATWADGTALDFVYDANGNLTGYSNRRGDDVTYTYDARGRLLSESDGSAGLTTYTYDAQGRMTSATNSQGTTSLTYDAADRVTQIDYPTGRSLTYTYNEAGQRASMSDGTGYEVFYSYDALGRLTVLSDGSGPVVTYTYDAAGKVLQEENGNGTVTTYDYDEAERLTRIENLAPDSSVNSFNAYTYDEAGQRLTNETQDGTWTYGYDAIGQLVSADFVSNSAAAEDKTIVYEYDDAGNRIRTLEDGSTEVSYETNELNQYTVVGDGTPTGPTGDATFTYDADGNMTSRTDPSGTTLYAYDLDNRLTSVTEADGTVLSFEYDLFGNRIAKTVDGVRTEFLVDPFGLGDVIAEFEGGAVTASYMHGLGLVSGVLEGETAYYDADAVGSVMTVTGTLGTVANSYLYTPFGDELSEIETLENVFEFNGVLGVSEDSDDLHFMRARSYSPELGRFLSEDPIYAELNNLYRFAANSPASYADPLGLFIVKAGVGGDLAIIFGFGAEVGVFADVSFPPDIGLYGTGRLNEGLELTAGINTGVYGSRSGAFDGTAVSLEVGAPGLVGGPSGTIAGTVSGGVDDPQIGGPTGGEIGFNIGPTIGARGSVSRTGDISVGDILRGIYDLFAGDDDAVEEIPSLEEESPVKPPIPENKPKLSNDVDPEVPDPERKPTFDEPGRDGQDSSQVDPADGDTRTYGDPHLITFDRTGYSFQAVGEFTMVLGDGFEMQVRMEAVNDNASANTAIAMQVGDDVIAVYANETIPLVANGTAVVLALGESIAIGDFTLHRTEQGTQDDLAKGEYIVTDSSGNGFYVRLFSGGANILPFVSDDAPVSGLLGNLDGDRSNDFTLRDGTVLSQPLPATQLYGEFADSWRVTQDSSLFLYREDESTDTFTDLDFPPRLLTLDDFDPAVVAEAEALAEEAGLVPGTFEFETTVLDIVLTGNSSFAEALGDAPDFTPEDAPTEPVVAVELNQAPVLPDMPQVTVRPNGVIEIDILSGATDEEGDPLTLIAGSDTNGGVLQALGSILRFTPDDDFRGISTLAFQVADGQGNLVDGSIDVPVNLPPNEIDGTRTSESLSGTAFADIINARAGDDVVRPDGGVDRVSLGSGSDIVSGSLFDLLGDTLTDFSLGDALIFEGAQFTRQDMSASGTPLRLGIDADQDGTEEGALTLEGDFSGGDFMAVRNATGTVVTFESYLQPLVERQAVNAGDINGIINPTFLSGANASQMEVTFGTAAMAQFSNSVGYYEIDATGALSNVTLLTANAKDGDDSVEINVSDTANDIGFFLIQDGFNRISPADFGADSFDFADDGEGGLDLVVDGVTRGDLEVFFSHDATLNSDGMEHVVSGVSDDGTGALLIGFEDLLRDRGGDDDFQDVVMSVMVG